MRSWLQALAKTRDRLRQHAARLFGGAADPAALEECEQALIQADIPAGLVAEWMERIRIEGPRRGPMAVARELARQALPDRAPFDWREAERPAALLIVGVNGSGKTTTAAKLARLVQQQGLKPLLAATDTFRAAGADQLRIWAQRVGCDVVAGVQGADAAAVAYDAVQAAKARGVDWVIVDTAGRMHTRQPLMEELAKVGRAIAKAGGGPRETWIVLDGMLGRNAISQARSFLDLARVTGVVVSKLDGSSKAGFILAIERDLRLPVRFVGLGEGMDDLAPFDPDQYVDALVGGSS